MTILRADWPLLERDPDTQAGIIRTGLDIRPFTGGLFYDFSTGAPGVAVMSEDRPCPAFIDTASPGAGSLVYAAASEVAPGGVTFPGIPLWAKMTSNSTSGQTIEFNRSFAPQSTSCGRVYVYFPVNVTTVRIVEIPLSGPSIRIRLEANRTITVNDNANVAKGTSPAALLAGTVYRVEWRVVVAANGSAVVTLNIYDGHSSATTNTFTTASFAVGAAGAQVTSTKLGNIGANLAGKFLYMGAVAVGCDALPGPYLQRRNVQQMVSPDGQTRYEMGPNGDVVIRANRDFHLTDGGSEIYLVQEGDVVGRWGNDGLYLQANTYIGDPVGVQDDDLHDITLDTKNRRISARGMNIRTLHDPPDFAYHAQELIRSPVDPSYGAIGSQAATTAGSDVVTFGDLTLIMRNRGHGILIDGNSYNIAEVTGPNTCRVKPTPTATGSGLTWKLKLFPYPLASQLRGMSFSANLAEPCRVVPLAHAPIASGSSGVTTNGTAVVDISALSAPNKAFWTVGRRVLINDDVSLMAAAPGRCFHILSVAGDGNSVTLDATCAALSNVKWKLASADTDGFAEGVLHPILTLVMNAETDIVNFSSTLGIGASDFEISMIRLDQLWNSSGGQAHNLFRFSSDGSFTLTEGPVDAASYKVGGVQFRVGDSLNVGSRGLLAETARIHLCGSAGVPTAQTILGGLIGLAAGERVAYILACVEVAAVGAAPTRIEFVLIGASGQQRATTGNVAGDAQFLTTGIAVFPVTVPYTILTGGTHYLSLLKDGAFAGTDVQLVRAANLASAMKPYGANARPGFRQSRSPGQGYPAGSVTMSNMLANEFFWMGCAA